MKKLPPCNEGREIFSEKLQLVQLQSQAALLAGSVVLVQQTGHGSLVNRLHSDLVSSFSSSLVTGNQSSLKLVHVGLQLGLVSSVLLVSDSGTNDILLGGLDIGHYGHSFLVIFIQFYIIAALRRKINPFLKNFFGKFPCGKQPVKSLILLKDMGCGKNYGSEKVGILLETPVISYVNPHCISILYAAVEKDCGKGCG
jgi:hypothetical protein